MVGFALLAGPTIFRERLSEKVHATIPKGIRVVLSPLFFKEIWNSGTRGILRTADVFPVVASLPPLPRRERSDDRKYVCYSQAIREAMDVCLRVLKESNKSRFDSYSVRKSVLIISHIAFQDCRMHTFSDNFSRNSCKHWLAQSHQLCQRETIRACVSAVIRRVNFLQIWMLVKVEQAGRVTLFPGELVGVL